MGMRHSSTVSSCTFHHIVECLILAKHSQDLHVYLRYHDDIMIVGKNPKVARPIVQELIGLAASCYVVKIEETSLWGVTMLDLFVFKYIGDDGLARFGWKPHITPTARHVPLHSSSLHAKFVHRSWPLAEIKRMFSLSKFRLDFLAFRQLKVDRFRKYHLPESIIDECNSWAPIPKCVVPGEPKPAVESGNVVRLILPFHPLVEQTIRSCLPEIASGLINLCKGVVPQFSLQCAFYNNLKPLHLLIRSTRSKARS